MHRRRLHHDKARVGIEKEKEKTTTAVPRTDHHSQPEESSME